MTRISLLCSALATSLLACGDNGGGATGGGSTAAATTGADVSSTGPGGSPTSAPPTTSEGGGTDTGGVSATTTGGPQPTTVTDGPVTTTQPDPTVPGTTPGTTEPDPSTDTGDDTTTNGGDASVLRFVAFGDVGEGNEEQYAVGQAMAQVCAMKGGCGFGIMLGDNFYDSGVDGVDDPQWQEKFEMPYEDIEFPIYAVLGNHDYGGNGIGLDFDTDKPDYQVEYTQVSQIWKMPSEYYSFTVEHAEFWGLDTNQIMTDPFNGSSDPQKNWLLAGTAASTATWKIAFGHHPYLSNGEHGNAGAYEDLEDIPIPFVAGENVKEFMDEAICGKVDVYFAGHDHTIQWPEPTCGTEFIVSGAGSKAGPLPGDNPMFFGAPETPGFMYVEIVDNAFTGTFYDQNAVELYSRTFMK